MSTQFRACIDIHNGAVKQIVGESLRDEGNTAAENFVSAVGAEYYAELYKNEGLRGGHIIMLNSVDSPYYEATKEQALKALSTYPGGMQIGGGITYENAEEFILAGASHVILTSYVFSNGNFIITDWRNCANCWAEGGSYWICLAESLETDII